MGIGLKFSLPVGNVRTELSPIELRKYCYWGEMKSETACYSYAFITPAPKTLTVLYLQTLLLALFNVSLFCFLQNVNILVHLSY